MFQSSYGLMGLLVHFYCSLLFIRQDNKKDLIKAFLFPETEHIKQCIGVRLCFPESPLGSVAVLNHFILGSQAGVSCFLLGPELGSSLS